MRAKPLHLLHILSTQCLFAAAAAQGVIVILRRHSRQSIGLMLLLFILLLLVRERMRIVVLKCVASVHDAREWVIFIFATLPLFFGEAAR